MNPPLTPSVKVQPKSRVPDKGKLPPAQIWDHLSAEHRQAVYQAFVAVSRQLLTQANKGKADEQS